MSQQFFALFSEKRKAVHFKCIYLLKVYSVTYGYNKHIDNKCAVEYR